MRLSDSAKYLRELALFAQELVLRAQVLPRVSWVAGQHPDVPQFQRPAGLRSRVDQIPGARGRTISAMPASFRAAPGSNHASRLFSSALDYLVDATLRRNLPTDFEALPSRRGRTPATVPAAESWMQALVSGNPLVTAPATEVQALQRALAEWDEYAQPDRNAAHLVLRLDEVAEGHEPGTGPDVENKVSDVAAGFRLDFMLRSAARPELAGGRCNGVA